MLQFLATSSLSGPMDPISGLQGCLKFPMFMRAVTFSEAEVTNRGIL